MNKPSSEEVREWAKQQNLDVDNAFNDHKTVKIGDKVHITQLKGKKVDILREVTNVYSDYFVIDSEFSDVFQIKVHFTDQYKIVEYGSNTALYKALYERATNEVEYLKKEIDFLQRQLEQSNQHGSRIKPIDPNKFLNQYKKQEDQ